MTEKHRLIVCVSCKDREARGARGERAGARLYESLSSRLDSWSRRRSFVVAPYECLSACTRPCVVALRAPGKYTYVFGDMAPMKSELSIVECAALYADRSDGFLNRDDRPPTMRAAILARVPPDFDD